MQDDERFAQSVATPLRAPERVDATFTARVMAAVWTIAAITPTVAQPAFRESQAQSHGAGRGTLRKWWRQPITLRVTPLGAFAALASVAAIVTLGGISLRRAAFVQPSLLPITTGPNTTAPALHDTTYIVRFMLMAPPAASSVTLVGDFNNWNRGAIQLAPTGRHGVWTASVAVPTGRHEYAFIVDGSHWIADPHAELTVTDDFGTESSILTVGARATPPAI